MPKSPQPPSPTGSFFSARRWVMGDGPVMSFKSWDGKTDIIQSSPAPIVKQENYSVTFIPPPTTTSTSTTPDTTTTTTTEDTTTTSTSTSTTEDTTTTTTEDTTTTADTTTTSTTTTEETTTTTEETTTTSTTTTEETTTTTTTLPPADYYLFTPPETNVPMEFGATTALTSTLYAHIGGGDFPVAGAAVDFTIITGGGSLSAPSGFTNGLGVATVDYTNDASGATISIIAVGKPGVGGPDAHADFHIVSP